MKKLIGICLLLSIISNTFAQTDVEYQKEYNNITKSLERKNFDNSDFADSVRLFVFLGNNIVHNKKSVNEVTVNDLNTILLYIGYNRFSISQAKSSMDKGFIISLYNPDGFASMYMVVNEDSKVSIILIRK